MIVLSHIEVIVPARNEERHITACLTRIHLAMDRLGADHGHTSCGITVVLDRCTDRTAARVAELGAHVVVSDHGRVGAARGAGVADAIVRSRRALLPDGGLWLANTDADSAVPANWLTSQVLFADAGVDAVIGTVTPADIDPEVDRRWRERHVLAEGHTHVHGANLGLRASTYLEAGGFADVAVHEDRDLVDRMKSVTARWVATHQNSVTTSARLGSRVDGGFATYMADLAAGDSACA